MEREFKVTFTDEVFDSVKHNAYHFNNGLSDSIIDPLYAFNGKGVQFAPPNSNLYGVIVVEIKPQGLTQEENEAAWHMRKENDQAIWDAAKEKEKKDKAEKEELIKDYGEDAINFIKKIDDTKTN